MPDENENENVRTHETAGRRAPAGEGVSAPFAEDSGGPPQMSVFDGAGNESVVTLGVNEDGRVAEGTGATLEDARKDAGMGDSVIGDDFETENAPK